MMLRYSQCLSSLLSKHHNMLLRFLLSLHHHHHHPVNIKSVFLQLISYFLKYVFACVRSYTLDHVSLCTPGRLSDVASRPAPPALVADSPDPEPPLSLPSHVLLWSLSSLACPLLYMACWPAPRPQPPPCYHSSEIQFHHTESYHQHVLQETAASNWACFSSWRWQAFSSPQCCQACKQQNTITVCFITIQDKTVRWQGNEIAWFLESKLSV